MIAVASVADASSTPVVYNTQRRRFLKIR